MPSKSPKQQRAAGLEPIENLHHRRHLPIIVRCEFRCAATRRTEYPLYSVLRCFEEGSMITRAERLELFRSYARQRDCALCKDWPRAERAARRMEVIQFPARICVRCDLAFRQSICVVTDSSEEFDA